MARIVTQALLDALRVTFNADFKRGQAKGKPVGQVLTTPVPSGTAINTYGFLGDLPIFRKWVGEKRLKTVQEKVYQLFNDPYEATLPIHKHQVADDQLGLYSSIFENWGEEAEAWPDRLRWDALSQGHQRACFDNQNFFDTDHPTYQDAGGTWSNMSAAGASQPWYLVDCSKALKPLIFQEREKPHFWWINDMMDSKVADTGIFTAYAEARGAVGYTMPFLAYRSTQPLDALSFIAARDAMAAWEDDNGEPRGIRPTHLVHGVSTRAAAEQTIKTQNLAGGASNIHWNEVALIYADRLP